MSHAVRVLALAATVASLLIGKPVDAEPRIVAVELGVAGKYRLGVPTLITARVEDAADQNLQLVAIAQDNDGLPVATTGGPIQEASPSSSTRTLSAIARLGKAAEPIVVRLLDEAGGNLAEQRIRPGTVVGDSVVGSPLALDDRLLVVIGKEAEAEQPLSNPIASVPALSQAPLDWRAYQAAHRVLLLADSITESEAAEQQLAALEKWVRRGGRLILSCGDAGPSLLGDSGPLVAFSPGTPAGVVPLRSTAPLETFAGANQPLRTDKPLSACRLTDVDGQVLCYDGPSREALPLVVRKRLGFGEVLFVAVDLNADSILDWQSRGAFYERLLDPSIDETAPLVDSAPNRRSDRSLSFELIRFLDSSLPGVSTAPLFAIVGLTTLYLLMIGPIDWFIVTRWLGRPHLTWVTFPITVLLFSAAVFTGAIWLRGARCATASIEVRDVQCSTGDARSLLLTQIYSPRPDRFDLRPSNTNADSHSSWFASADGRLGGLASGATMAADVSLGGYAINSGEFVGLPLATGSTKTLVTETYTAAQPTVLATLRPSTGGLITGSVTNETGEDLVDCQLWHNGWAWRLGAFGEGATKTIDDSGNLLRITTLLGKQLDQRELSSQTLASMISFGQLIDRRRDPPENHLLPTWDLTNQLDIGHAILVGRVAEGIDSLRLVGDARTGKAPQQNDVFVRYIIEVEE